MSILSRDHVHFSCPELDVPQGALPEKLQILLCLIEGAERRRLLQAKLYSLPGQRSGRGESRQRPGVGDLALWSRSARRRAIL
jgi:hypothetical protein